MISLFFASASLNIMSNLNLSQQVVVHFINIKWKDSIGCVSPGLRELIPSLLMKWVLVKQSKQFLSSTHCLKRYDMPKV